MGKVENLNKVFAPCGLRVNGVDTAPNCTVYKINLDFGTNVKRALKMRSQVAIALDSNDFEMAQNGAHIEIREGHHNYGVSFSSLLPGFIGRHTLMDLSVIIGIDDNGRLVTADLATAPHLLIAGGTGSGKSMFLHSVILSLLCNHRNDLRLVLIDPKQTEFVYYSGMRTVEYINRADAANQKFADLLDVMKDRYTRMKKAGCRDICEYNREPAKRYMPSIVVVVDEFAELIEEARAEGKKLDLTISRLAQMGRACGIHLVIATQSPRRDVITGLIKANMPSKIALKVANSTESRIIIDHAGAEKLQGHGDLIMELQDGTSTRVQAGLVTAECRNEIIKHVGGKNHVE